MNIDIIKTTNSRLSTTDFSNLQFGNVFSDHMFYIDYSNNAWGSGHIIPFGEISIFPSLSSLHYGQAIFEGMKAFKHADGRISVFRPKDHHERLNKSAHRVCIPDLSFEDFISGMEELIKLDAEWVPNKRGCSLYLRPFTFATDNFLGVRVSETYKFMILACPVGSYYKEGINPISLMTSGEYVRAVKGGMGETKTPGNYAASLYPAQVAKEKGYTQVLWLDGVERKYIDEIGTTNIFFLIGDDLITPPLDGSILGGVTRMSVMELAKDMGIKVVERRISIDEVIESSNKGILKEVFGTGTAAVISPVGKIHHNGIDVVINNGKTGELSQRIYDEITAIQYGEKEDKFGWNYYIN